MDSNPWESESGRNSNNPYIDHNSVSNQRQEPQRQQQPPQQQQPQSQSQPQPHQTSYDQPHLSYQPHQAGYQQPQEDWTRQDPTDNPWGSQTTRTEPYQPPSHPPPQLQSYQPTSYSYSQPPAQNLRRSDTDDLLEAQPDRAEQVEYLQQYEASKPISDDDRNQEQLQKQFPRIDSSLIAAIYNDYKQGAGRVDMAQIQEMLQELQS